MAACIGMAGQIAPAGAAGVLAATRAVIAIMDGELFIGEAEGHLDGAGTLVIHSRKNPSLSCRGEFTSSAELGGNGSLRCSDGATATFQFRRLGIFRGHGAGTTSKGTMSFAYGLAPEDAAPYLKMPAGKKFSTAGTELTLVDL